MACCVTTTARRPEDCRALRINAARSAREHGESFCGPCSGASLARVPMTSRVPASPTQPLFSAPLSRDGVREQEGAELLTAGRYWIPTRRRGGVAREVPMGGNRRAESRSHQIDLSTRTPPHYWGGVGGKLEQASAGPQVPARRSLLPTARRVVPSSAAGGVAGGAGPVRGRGALATSALPAAALRSLPTS